MSNELKLVIDLWVRSVSYLCRRFVSKLPLVVDQFNMIGKRCMMKDKLKIGITCYPTLGGSGVVATELGKLLAEKGHEVHFITHSMPFRLGKFHKNIFYHEVEVSDYYVFRYPPYDLSLASKLAQVAKMEELGFTACALCDSSCGLCTCWRNRWLVTSKVVTTLHGTDITVLARISH